MITIIYDGDCPLCRDYSRRLKLIETVGEVVLCDARSNHPEVLKAWQQGFDLDQGMIAVVDGVSYYGADAVHVLACLSSDQRLFNRLNRALLSHPPIARLAYPFLKALRRLALLLTGKGALHSPVSPDGSPQK